MWKPFFLFVFMKIDVLSYWFLIDSILVVNFF